MTCDLSNKDSLIVLSHNLVSDKNQSRKLTRSTTEEAIESLSASIKCCQITNNFKEIGNAVLFPAEDPAGTASGETSNRKDLKISVKIILSKCEPSAVKKATEEVMRELKVDYLDMVILTPPLSVLRESDEREVAARLEDLKVYWKVLEELVRDGIALSIGFSDLDSNLLEALHQWAEIKPTVNQINMASCCITPPEMAAFAKENGIQLLTHNDARDMLPEDSVKEMVNLLKPHLTDAENWSSDWIIRYHVLARFRGVLQNKGFILSIKRNN